MQIKLIGIWVVRALLLGAFLALTLYVFDWLLIRRQSATLLARPGWLIWMTAMYISAFALRAWAWRTYLQRRVSFADCMHGLFYSLFLNHILPIKVGDAVRIGYIATRQAITWDEAAHSVVVLRLLDMLVLGAIAATGMLALGLALSTAFFWFFLAASVAGCGAVYMWLRTKPYAFWEKHLRLLQSGLAGSGGILVIGTTFVSWLLEAWVVVGVIRAINLELSFVQGVWANSMTIAGQVFHFTPGGVGTYESVMSFTLAALGIRFQDAYIVALLSHGFKFAFSYVVGAYVLLRVPISFHQICDWIGKKKNRNE
ncbi:lysylphosphatidylglycerol synthase transmembrane domain-containing protein [Aneurinibacillus danicus]|uniref:Phosphatidylglycerol lysyltransferase n=1 Tax=Aneurinibacillus danicus TaxID=267746 RepID=A0A511V665_9BACL|nr:lysylphosphatidylglycerol synthase transmembrane domain-containing protein [Aneurinibacillus danicus]GEN32662.1 hypothetical protein ADA01nite_01220 [Aneurinibacillus danicus]